MGDGQSNGRTNGGSIDGPKMKIGSGSREYQIVIGTLPLHVTPRERAAYEAFSAWVNGERDKCVLDSFGAFLLEPALGLRGTDAVVSWMTSLDNPASVPNFALELGYDSISAKQVQLL